VKGEKKKYQKRMLTSVGTRSIYIYKEKIESFLMKKSLSIKKREMNLMITTAFLNN